MHGQDARLLKVIDLRGSLLLGSSRHTWTGDPHFALQRSGVGWGDFALALCKLCKPGAPYPLGLPSSRGWPSPMSQSPGQPNSQGKSMGPHYASGPHWHIVCVHVGGGTQMILLTLTKSSGPGDQEQDWGDINLLACPSIVPKTLQCGSTDRSQLPINAAEFSYHTAAAGDT